MNMQRVTELLVLVFIGAGLVCAQNANFLVPGVGVKAGVPLNQMFSTYSISALDYPTRYTPYSYAVPRYQVGLYADFHFTKHWGFEVDGLFRRGGFSFEQPANQAYAHTVFNNWEFPFLIQYNLTHGRLRPFLNAGAALRHISGVQTVSWGAFPTTTQSSSDILRNSGSWGGVVGVGLTFKEGPLEISPEVRYTRWVNQSFNAVGLVNSLNEGVFLLGIGF